MTRRQSLATLALLTSVLTIAPDVPLASWRAQPVATAAQTALPKVRLIATGGTISNRAGGRLTADELVASMRGVISSMRAARAATR